MKSQDETLEEWCRLLLRAFELEDVQVDVNEVLSLAGVAAHSVVRPAAAIAAGLGELHSLQRPGSGEAAASAGGAPF
ncbi:MAG: molybdopterin-guanine dinucleotide biosynthesis protein, partial [Arthrobacter sp.]|nr:molybdopterin-guanine dinucleotide biosynthesis protein [Arthrobacter sp.]